MLAAMQTERSGARPGAGELRLLNKPRIRSQAAQSLDYLLPETERTSIRARRPGLDQMLLRAYAQADTPRPGVAAAHEALPGGAAVPRCRRRLVRLHLL